MTAQELINELQKYPGGTPVKVLISEVYGGYDETGQYVDDQVQVLTPEDAIEADSVVFEGAYILIESK